MVTDIQYAEYCGEYKIKLTFADGKKGIVDFSRYVSRGGVFQRFKDINYFKNFVVDPEVKTLVWNNEIDIAPETLYSAATNDPLPQWMVNEE